jgi:hypothetical protein
MNNLYVLPGVFFIFLVSHETLEVSVESGFLSEVQFFQKKIDENRCTLLFPCRPYFSGLLCTIGYLFADFLRQICCVDS